MSFMDSGAFVEADLLTNPPTDISLTATSVLENRNVNYTMGTFNTADPEGGPFTYSLVTGTGDGDNASFNILNSTLRVNGPFDFETRNLYSVRVRSTDSGGQWLEKTFTIEVLDVNEPPVAVNDAATTAHGTPIDIPVLDNDTDPEGTQLQISSPSQACVFVVGVNCPLHYVPAPDFCGTDTASYTVTDGEYTATAEVTVTVACAPAATTPGIVSLSTSGATLTGEVNPRGAATTARFAWGTDPLLASPTLTAPVDLGDGTSPVPVFVALGEPRPRRHLLLPGCGTERRRDRAGRHRLLRAGAGRQLVARRELGGGRRLAAPGEDDLAGSRGARRFLGDRHLRPAARRRPDRPLHRRCEPTRSCRARSSR